MAKIIEKTNFIKMDESSDVGVTGVLIESTGTDETGTITLGEGLSIDGKLKNLPNYKLMIIGDEKRVDYKDNTLII